jgi:hypothetical protein
VEPELQHHAAPAPKLMFNIGVISKISQTVAVTSFSHSLLLNHIRISEEQSASPEPPELNKNFYLEPLCGLHFILFCLL